MPKRRTATLYGLAIALLWGLSFLSIKVALREVPPMTMAAARFLMAAAALPLLARWRGISLRVAPRDLPLLAAGGFVGVTLYFYGENHGVALLTASLSSIIIGTIPVITVLAERVFLGTRLGAPTYAGAVLSCLGVAVIVIRPEAGTSSLAGFAYMGLATAAWVLYSFLTRPVALRYGRLAITFWQILFGLLTSVPFALAESAQWQAPSLSAMLNLAYLGLLCTALGYWLYISALELLGPGRSSLYLNLIPVVSVVAAYFILGERLGLFQALGGAAAVAGVYLATARQS
jgi:drug/metabolite transporter (DMT)-like permease